MSAACALELPLTMPPLAETPQHSAARRAVLSSDGGSLTIASSSASFPTGAAVQIWKQDCRAGLAARIPDASVDFVLTDPPYGIDGMGEEWDHAALAGKASRASVIGSLPVGMKFDRQQGKQLYDFLLPVFSECLRVLKPGGFMVAFSQGRLYNRLATAAEDAGFEIRDMLGWTYEGQAKAFSQDHFVRKMKIPDDEKARILAELGGRKTPQLKPMIEPMVLAQKPREGTFVENWMAHGVGLVDTSQQLDGKFPGNIMAVPKPSKAERGEENGHFTVKPLRLMDHLIRLFTKEGAVVVDPFIGSGTTALSALRTDRRCVGFEISDAYFEVIRRRLDRA